MLNTFQIVYVGSTSNKNQTKAFEGFFNWCFIGCHFFLAFQENKLKTKHSARILKLLTSINLEFVKS